MDNEVKCFKLGIKRSVYFQDGHHHEMNMTYLNFYENGKVSLNGNDCNGPFEFTGELKDGYLRLKKQYTGERYYHAVYYLGKLVSATVNLVYAFADDYNTLLLMLNSNVKMAEIEFTTEPFNVFFKEEDKTNIILMDSSSVENGKFRGICIKDGKFVVVKAKIKCELKFADADSDQKFKGKFNAQTNTFIVKETDD